VYTVTDVVQACFGAEVVLCNTGAGVRGTGVHPYRTSRDVNGYNRSTGDHGYRTSTRIHGHWYSTGVQA